MKAKASSLESNDLCLQLLAYFLLCKRRVKMNKYFLLLFSLFFLILATTSLRCATCHLHLARDRCRRGFGMCVAQKNEKCMHLKVIINSTHVLSYMDCQKFCKNGKKTTKDHTYQYICCGSNYCNRKG
ncbi:prostate and testis expressed protein 3 [Octodon degus]|uniref:Prostate and testis expressed protein 3 n=1 Tax=Octodon degus TaxID=10160 RepID=A0A6P3F9L4_OCTDE|nr:prostate and testis expressed protein 3 [Octodon degus]